MESMMTARQVAELLGVHENWVYDQASNGALPSYKIGGARRFDPQELRTWLAAHRGGLAPHTPGPAVSAPPRRRRRRRERAPAPEQRLRPTQNLAELDGARNGQ